MAQIYRDEDHNGHKVDNIKLGNTILDVQASAPLTGVEGQLFYNQSSKRMEFHNGEAWNIVSSGASAMRYRGTVTDWGLLPTTGNVGGDYWINSTTQTSRVWNGTTQEWDDTGSVSIEVDETLSSTSANPVANKAIANALNGKLNTPGIVPGTTQPYNLSYFFYTVPSADKVEVHAKTVTLDNSATQGDYSLDVLPATSAQAGLMSANDKDVFDNLRWAGTRAEYSALATKDIRTTYYITDEGKLIRNDVEYGGSGSSLPTVTLNFTVNDDGSVTAPFDHDLPTRMRDSIIFMAVNMKKNGVFVMRGIAPLTIESFDQTSSATPTALSSVFQVSDKVNGKLYPKWYWMEFDLTTDTAYLYTRTTDTNYLDIDVNESGSETWEGYAFIASEERSLLYDGRKTLRLKIYGGVSYPEQTVMVPAVALDSAMNTYYAADIALTTYDGTVVPCSAAFTATSDFIRVTLTRINYGAKTATFGLIESTGTGWKGYLSVDGVTPDALWAAICQGEYNVKATVSRIDSSGSATQNFVLLFTGIGVDHNPDTEDKVACSSVYSADFDNEDGPFRLTLNYDEGGSQVLASIEPIRYADKTTTETSLADLNDKITLVTGELGNKVDKIAGYGLSNITLNGTHNDAPSFYAPTIMGTSGSFVTVLSDGTIGWKAMASAMTFKGSKTGQELATGTGWTNGDTYYCTADYSGAVSFLKGNTYTFSSAGWVNIGSSVDLTAYLKKKEYEGQSVTPNTFLIVNASGEITTAAKTLDTLETEISAKSKVKVIQTVTSGTEIGEVEVDGAATKLYAPKVTVDTKMDSTSTNPVQNKVVNAAINGRQATLPKTGSATYPIYTSAAGTITQCSQYAGGTNVTLNGSNKSGGTAGFYAPTSDGSGGKWLMSVGKNPYWDNIAKDIYSTNITTKGQFILTETADHFTFLLITGFNNNKEYTTDIIQVADTGGTTLKTFFLNSSSAENSRYATITINGTQLTVATIKSYTIARVTGIFRKAVS